MIHPYEPGLLSPYSKGQFTMVDTYSIVIRIETKKAERKIKRLLPTSEGLAYKESIAIINAMVPKIVVDARVSRVTVHIMNMTTYIESLVFDSDDRR